MAGKRGKDWGIKRDAKTGTFGLDFSINGRRCRASAFTADREEARRKRDLEAQRLWSVAVAGERPAMTWNEASLEWLAQQERQGVRTIEDMRDKLRWFAPHLGELRLTDIDDAVVSTVLGVKRKEGRRLPRGRRRVLASATLNRYYAVISAVFHFAILKSWATHCPRFVEKVREATGEERTVRWLKPEEWSRLHAALPLHLRQMARFAIATGLRERNVTHLEWERVDVARRIAWILGDGSKSKRAFQVPLNSDALAVILEQQEARDRHDLWVFPFKGKAIDNPAGAAWKKAKARAGIDAKFRWHDLRHTWATWHVMNGTKLEVLMALGGWHSYEMVLTYAHQADTYLAQYAENPLKGASVRQDPVNAQLLQSNARKQHDEQARA